MPIDPDERWTDKQAIQAEQGDEQRRFHNDLKAEERERNERLYVRFAWISGDPLYWSCGHHAWIGVDDASVVSMAQINANESTQDDRFLLRSPHNVTMYFPKEGEWVPLPEGLQRKTKREFFHVEFFDAEGFIDHSTICETLVEAATIASGRRFSVTGKATEAEYLEVCEQNDLEMIGVEPQPLVFAKQAPI